LTIFNTTDPRDIPAYSISEAAHYLGVPSSTLRSWFAGQTYSHQGVSRQFRAVIRPADPKRLGLSFSNLVEAYVLTAIRRKHHVGLQTTRRGLAFLTEKLGSKRPLLEEQFDVVLKARVLRGRVVDENGAGVEGAIIQTNAALGTTDADGYFRRGGPRLTSGTRRSASPGSAR